MPPSTRPPTKPTSTSTSTARTRSPETYASLAQRNHAAQVLESYEELAYYALATNESLAQTRLHFLSQVAGFTVEDEKAQVDWKTDTAPHHPDRLPTSIYSGLEPLGGEGRRKSSVAGKGKERASLGGGAGRASPREGRTSLGGEGSAGGSGRKKRRSAGVGS